MISTFDSYNHIIRLDRGERLSEAMEEFFANSKIEIRGAAVSGVGAAERLELGFYDLNSKEYQWKTFEDLYEITSLTGTIALDEHGTPMYHLHGTFSGRDYQVIGGHVKDLVVGGTCELFVHTTYQPLRRRRDDDTGLKLLDL